MKIVINEKGRLRISGKFRDMKRLVRKHGQVFADWSGRILLATGEKKCVGTIRFYREEKGKGMCMRTVYVQMLEKTDACERGDIMALNRKMDQTDFGFDGLFGYRIRDGIYDLILENMKKNPNRDWTKEVMVLKRGQA